jgi:AcrR family transcriptional regulator
MANRMVLTAAEVTQADGLHALRGLLDPQQAETKRERLLRAAFNVIGERGYESTSVARIARAADMAPGLVHYYFASKDDLLVAVADWCSHLFDDALANLPELDDGFELLRSRIERVQDIVALLPAWYVVRGDLYALAVRLPAMREQLARVEAEARARVAAVVQRALSLAGGDPRRFDLEGVSASLLGAFDGLAQQAMVDPSFDLPRAYRALADAFIALLREAAGPAEGSSREDHAADLRHPR